MFRAVLELVLTIFVIIVARAVLTSLLRALSNVGRSGPAASSTGTADDAPSRGNELHKDPVCGTYVAESTPHRRQAAGQVFYYCSEECRAKHVLVAR